MGTIRNRGGILYVDTRDENGKRLVRSTGLRVGQEAEARRVLTAVEQMIEAERQKAAGEAERVRLGKRKGWHLASVRPKREGIPLPAWKACGIYIVQEDFESLVKIGFASNVRARVRGLQTACPQELRLIGVIPGDYSDELDLHERFKWARFRGEWYWPAEEILDLADAHRELDRDALFPDPGKARKDQGTVWADDPGSVYRVPTPRQ